MFSREERCHWNQFYGICLHCLYGHYVKMMKSQEVRLAVFDKGVHALVYVTTHSSKNNYRAKAWCLLGTFFWEQLSQHGSTPQSVTANKFLAQYRHPEKCFLTALELSPTDVKIMSRYSRYLIHNDGHQEAIDVLTTAIELDDTRKNWFSFFSRGKAYINLYLARKKACQSTSRGRVRNRWLDKSSSIGHPPGKTLLQKGVVDYKHSLKLNRENLQDMIALGSAYHLQKNYEKAMKKFQYVVDHLEGRINNKIHGYMGHCLKDLDRTRAAAESFKRALECSNRDWFAQPMFHVLQLLFKQSERQGDPQHLLEEICFWLAEGHAKYRDVSPQVYKLCRWYPQKMLSVCRAVAAKKQYSLAEQCLTSLKEISTTPEISQLLDEISVTGGMASMSHSDTESTPFLSSSAILPPLTTRRNKVGKAYDWLVLHCNQGRDADWVCYSLLPRLEDCHRYKGCVPDRDTEPDADVLEIAKDAACVIVILTPAFTDDGRCQEVLSTISNDD